MGGEVLLSMKFRFQGGIMHKKKCKGCGFFPVLLVFTLVMPATAQMKRIFKFQNVKLPFDLVIAGKEIRKGAYHFEFLRHQTQAKNYLRICKGRKFLCCVPGDEQQYETYGRMKFLDPEIPKKPRMQLFKHPINKQVYVVFESGKKTGVYPFLKVKYKFDLME